MISVSFFLLDFMLKVSPDLLDESILLFCSAKVVTLFRLSETLTVSFSNGFIFTQYGEDMRYIRCSVQ